MTPEDINYPFTMKTVPHGGQPSCTIGVLPLEVGEIGIGIHPDSHHDPYTLILSEVEAHQLAAALVTKRPREALNQFLADVSGTPLSIPQGQMTPEERDQFEVEARSPLTQKYYEAWAAHQREFNGRVLPDTFAEYIGLEDA